MFNPKRHDTLSRHQLAVKLHREQPHLKYGSPAFRQALVVRAIYQVGTDIPVLANFLGYRASYVKSAMLQQGTAAMKAYRAYLTGREYSPTLRDTLKSLGRTIKQTLLSKLTSRKA